jgi:outer membrane lipoprotein-sorting protein
MKTHLVLASLFAITALQAADSPNAQELASKLAEAVNDGASTARLKMDIIPASGQKIVLQLKANALRTTDGSSVHYQVLWPKDRTAGSFVLRKPAGGATTGSVLQADGSVKPVTQTLDGIFDSDLAYEDVVGNYFAWEKQAVTGDETVKGNPCVILESKPGSGDRSAYGSVRTWIDAKRLVPLRIEKYSTGGQLVRRITITLVSKDDKGRTIPANFAIERPGSESRTVIEGSNIKHDVSLTAADFSPDVLKPKAAAGQ